jgi:TetR/AcrR family transcriptional regulator, acrAB operon repressor
VKRNKLDAAQTRETLLEAALEVFSAKGYTASTLEDIAKAAGVTRGALYHHFSGKAELYTTLVTQAASQPGQIVQQTLAEGGTFLEIMHTVFVRQIRAVEQNPRYRATAQLAMFKLEPNPELEQANALLSQGRQATLELLTQAFAEGIAQGVIRPNLEPVEVARTFISLQIGLFHVWSTHPQSFDLERSATVLADVMIAGIQARA